MIDGIHGTYPWRDGKGVFSDTPFSDLAAAIVGQAIKDYIRIQRKLWKPDKSVTAKRELLVQRAELEDFFYSEWFEAISDIEPSRLLRGCRAKAEMLEKKSIMRSNRKNIKQKRKRQFGEVKKP